MEEKKQIRETEDQRYRGEREVERKIGTIHRGEKYRRERREKKRGEKEDIDSVERHGSIDRG